MTVGLAKFQKLASLRQSEIFHASAGLNFQRGPGKKRRPSRRRPSVVYPPRKLRRARTPGGLSIFPCPSTDVRGELENVPRTAGGAVKSFRWGALLPVTLLGHARRVTGVWGEAPYSE